MTDRLVFASPLVLLLLAACSPAPQATSASCSAVQPTLASIQSNVFTKNCAQSSCHAADNPQRGLDLSTPCAAMAHLVDVPASEGLQADGTVKKLVVPGHPEESFLLDKLTNTNLVPSVNGQPMPYGSFPMCQQKVDAIRAWIQAGAPFGAPDGGACGGVDAGPADARAADAGAGHA